MLFTLCAMPIRSYSFFGLVPPVFPPAGHAVLVAIVDDGADLLGLVHDVHEVDVFWADISLRKHRISEPSEQSFPITSADQNDGETPDFFGLNERKRFEEFIHGPKAPGEYDIPDGVLHEHQLPYEKVAEFDPDVLKLVRGLLQRKIDVQADGDASGVLRALVCRLHDAGPSSRDDGEAVLRQTLGHLQALAVVRRTRRETRASENRHGGSDAAQGLETLHQFGHDSEHTPGIGFCQIFHCCSSPKSI